MSSASLNQRRFKRFIGYPVEAALVYALYGFFRLLPLDMASNLGGWIGRSLGPRLGASKKVRRNLALAMPELSAAQRDAITTGMWDNLGRVMAEYPHLGELDASRVEVIGKEHLDAVLAQKRPLLMVSGHLANWEVIPVTATNHGLDPQLIYRHANNPYVEKLLSRARSVGSTRLARKGVEGARSVHGALRNSEVVGMLVDQKHNRGLAIPFFGQPAMTAPAVAELALKYSAPIIMGRLERLDGARFRVTIDPPLDVSSGNVTEILTRINARLEEWIRLRPEQWLWLHKRWSD